MYDPDARKLGELKFKNPWDSHDSQTMTDAEIRFLKFALFNFAKNATMNSK